MAALTPGTTIGPYKIVSAIGAGGMGEVYRARDTKLDRDVAIKVLPDAVAADRERLARFTREAKTLASLNHTNIAHIHGLEESRPSAGSGQAGVLAIVMELVEGEDLSQRIARGPIPLDEAMLLARQIAEAIDYAHQKGVLHRDLKPANIQVVRHGEAPTIKVLDFGLAKAVASDGVSPFLGDSPTLTGPADPATGVLLGTAGYMAPEQARGKPVDRRADIWAFGCLLFEMLTGHRVFGAATLSDTLAAVLKSEPEWHRLPADTPAAVRRLLRRCLEKEPRLRLHDIADARLELDDAIGSRPEAPIATRGAGGLRWASAGAMVGAVVAGTVGVGIRSLSPVAPLESLLHYTVNIPTTRGMGPANFALSPDGRAIAYAGSNESAASDLGTVNLRSLDSLDSRPVASVGQLRSIAWSPDSRSIVTTGNNGVIISDLASGATQVIDPSIGGLLRYGVAWGRGRTLLRALGPNGLEVFTPEGNSAAGKHTLRDDQARLWPSVLADGKRYLFVRRTGNEVEGDVCIGHVDSDTVRCLNVKTGSGVQAAEGMLLYLSGRVLLAQPFDETSESLRGDPTRIVSDVALGYLNVGAFSASRTRRLAYRTGAAGLEETRWVDRSGRVFEAIGDPRVVVNFDLSQDGRTVAVADGEWVWVTDIARSVTFRSGTERGAGVSPALSADGSKLAVMVGGRVTIQDVAGSGPAIPTNPPTREGIIEDWSPDGKWIALTSGWLVAADGSSAAVQFAKQDAEEIEFSPDSRWLVFNQRRGAERANVFVTPVAGGAEQWQVSVRGGVQGRWRPDGREIYYLAPDGVMMAVSVRATGGRLAFSAPQPLFGTGLQVSDSTDQYKVGRDGRFLISRPVIPPDRETVAVIVNWPQLLRGQVGQ